MVEDIGLIVSKRFQFARMETKQVKPDFGIDCYAIYGIVHSLASVNEFFEMTKNYSRGFQMMLIGR